MVALVVVVLDERLDLSFEIAGQEVVFEQDTVFHGLVPALDLTLGLGTEWCATHVAHPLGFDIFRQFSSDIARTVIRQQARLVMDLHPVAARGYQRQGPACR